MDCNELLKKMELLIEKAKSLGFSIGDPIDLDITVVHTVGSVLPKKMSWKATLTVTAEVT